MNLTEFAIRRWQLTLVLFILLCALGYSAFRTIPRAVDPHFELPIVIIAAVQPGADAAEQGHARRGQHPGQVGPQPEVIAA